MGKLDGQDDGLFQRLFGHLEPSNVVPADVGLVYKDRAREAGAQFFHLWVAILVVLPKITRASRPPSAQIPGKTNGTRNSLLSFTASPSISHPVRSNRSPCALLTYLRQVLLELFGTTEVFRNLGLDQTF